MHQDSSRLTERKTSSIYNDFSVSSNKSISLRTPASSSVNHDYFETKISGDSGNPSFFVIHNQLVLLFTFTTGGAGGGTNLVYYFDDINHLMEQLGGGYRLTEMDLSAYLGGLQSVPAIIG